MLLMKQARAFGVGVVLATQNPVDVDYKALSNAGTWMIGRLQTDRDKQRLLDGMSAAAGGVDVGAVGDTISGLGQARVRAAPGRQGPARGVHHPLGDELPARPDDPRPDRAADAGAAAAGAAPRGRRRPAAAADGGRRAGARTRRRRRPRPAPPIADVTPVMPEVGGGVAVRWVDPAAPWLGAVGGDAGGDDPRRGGRRPRRPALRRHQGRPRPRRGVRGGAVPARRATSTSRRAVAVDYDDRDLRDAAPAGVAVPADRRADRHRRRSGSSVQRDLVDHLARSLTHRAPGQPRAQAVRPARRVRRRLRRPLRCRSPTTGPTPRSPSCATSTRPRRRKLRDQIDAADRRRRGRRRRSSRPAARDDLLSSAGSILGGLLGGRRSRGGLLGQLGRAAGRTRQDVGGRHAGRGGEEQGRPARGRARGPRGRAGRGAHRDRRPLDGAGAEQVDDDADRPRAHRRQGHPARAGLDPGAVSPLPARAAIWQRHRLRAHHAGSRLAAGTARAGGGTRTLTDGVPKRTCLLPIGLHRPARRSRLRGTLGGRWRCTTCRRRRW